VKEILTEETMQGTVKIELGDRGECKSVVGNI